MALKNIPDSGFPDDDGSAAPELAEALAAWQADPSAPAADQRVLAALAGTRLLVPVVAVLGETETGPDGLRHEKTSDMAVPTLTAPGGRRALPAFTSTEALARWREDARPVAVPVRQALQALAQEDADTLVLDLSGPVTYQVTGHALQALAGQPADPAVAEALRTVLAAEPRVRAAHLAPGDDTSDGTLALSLAHEGEQDAVFTAAARPVVQRLAQALAADETLRSRLVHGLNLALLPPDATLPSDLLYRR